MGWTDDELVQKLKSRGTPFDHLDVKGPYDSQRLPSYPSLLAKPLGAIKDALERHRNAPLSPPIVLVLGGTGDGKSYLLRELAIHCHGGNSGTPKYFIVRLGPEAVLRAATGEPVDAARPLLRALAEALFDDRVPGFRGQDVPEDVSGVRPIDVFAAEVVGAILEDVAEAEQRLAVPRFLGLLTKSFPHDYPEEVKEQCERCGPHLRFDGPGLRDHPDAVEVLSRTILERNGEAWALREKILRAALGGSDLESALSPDGDGALERLEGFVAAAAEIERPIAFACDQFEDLRILDSGDLRALAHRFLLSLLDLLREIERKGGSHRAPLCILACTWDLDPLSTGEQHVKDRLPILPHGDKAVRIESPSLPDAEAAIELAEKYLETFRQDLGRGGAENRRLADEIQERGREWPFERSGLAALYRKKKIAENLVSIRAWLLACRTAWHALVSGEGSLRFEERRRAWMATLDADARSTDLGPLPKPTDPRPTPRLPDPGPPLQPPDPILPAPRRGPVDAPDKPRSIESLVRDRSLRSQVGRWRKEAVDKTQFEALFGFLRHAADLLPSLLPSARVQGENHQFSFSYTGFRVVAAVSFKDNRGSGSRADWQDLVTLALARRNNGEPVDRLYFLRTVDQKFPPSHDAEAMGFRVTQHVLTDEDWRWIHAVHCVAGEPKIDLGQAGWSKEDLAGLREPLAAKLETLPLFACLRETR